MAKIFNSMVNVEEAKLAPLTEASTGDSYGQTADMAGLQSLKLAITLASAVLYGDGVALDEVSEFVSGALEAATAGESDETLALINGQTVAQGAVDDTINDERPLLGMSFIAKTRKKSDAGVSEGYTAYFLPRVKFAPQDDELTAKTENVTYSKTTLKATVFANRDGRWRRRKFCATMADARTWVNQQFGAAAP
jgi:hypothetical protein